jgi:hypothetical protein
MTNFYGKWQQNPEVTGLLKVWDLLTNSFKGFVTVPWPAFHARNAISNVAQSVLDIGMLALNPQYHGLALRVMLGGKYPRLLNGTFTTANGRKIPLQALRNQMIGLDVLPTKETITEIIEGGVGTVGPAKLLQKTFGKLGQFIENEARGMHFLALKAQGLSSADAAFRMKKFLVDYADLSPAERNFLRRIFPFYTWQSKNVRMQIKTLATKPGIIAAEALPFRERAPDAEFLPQYLRGELKMRLEDGPDGNPRYVTNVDLPFKEIDQLYKGSPGKTLINMINQFSPLVKIPFEIAFGQDSFTGRSIKGHVFAGTYGPMIDKWPEKWKEWLNFEKFPTRDGRILYKLNGTKLYMMTKIWYVSRLASTGAKWSRLMADMGDKKAAFLAVATGLTLHDMDLSEAQNDRMRENLRRLQEIVADEGVAAKFTKYFVPGGMPSGEKRSRKPFGGRGGGVF